ncbi:helix-turn-helix transcriptional regulator [Proteiniphilum sp.]|nr:helix-turn-helix transcriptional regulator [Proteiniphilum sp.]MEA4918114.1 helix-turn-helix transcriptional regulator [Proteiniphilum sp.]
MKENLKEIRLKKGLTQQFIADALNIDLSAVSKLENGIRQLKYNELEIIAHVFGMSVIDIIAYPDTYVKKDGKSDKEPVEAILQIKLQSDKKDQVLKLIFGEHNLEILNK